MWGKIIYCVCWSIGLFFATFYSLFNEESVFNFSEKQLLPVAKSIIMPMIMAMALYLCDVIYNNFHIKQTTDRHQVFWILLSITLFMVLFVFSLLVNKNIVGWLLFIFSWLCLLLLKFKTTESKEIIPYEISEE